MSVRRCLGLARVSVLAAALCGWAAALPADQHAPELATLFTALGGAKDVANAHSIEQQIWALWFKAPNDRAADLLAQARKAVESGELNDALSVFDQLVSEFPDYAEGWNQRAIVHFLLNNIDGALADVDKTLALEPRHFGALSGRGQCFIRLKRPRDALTAFEATLALNPWLEGIAQQADRLRAYVRQQPTAI